MYFNGEKMENIRLIIISAGVIGVVMNIFEAVYPSEKYQNQMKMIFSLIFILCLIVPIKNNIKDISDIEKLTVSTDKKIEYNENCVEDYFKASVERNISSQIGDQLKNEKIPFKEIKTSITISENGGIYINEIIITAESTLQGDEIIDIVKEKISEDTLIKIEEKSE